MTRAQGNHILHMQPQDAAFASMVGAVHGSLTEQGPVLAMSRALCMALAVTGKLRPSVPVTRAPAVCARSSRSCSAHGWGCWV